MSRSARWVAAGLVVLVGLAAGGCKKKSGEAVVGFSQVGAESSWRTAETKSIQEEAAKRNYDLRFADAQQKQRRQIDALRSFIAQQVDVIVLAPKVATGWDQVLKEAKKADIPVILVDRGVTADESLYATKIAADFVEEGRIAGRWLAGKLHNKGNIAELRGHEGSAPAIDRKKGFEEIINKHDKLKIILTETGDFSREGGKRVMKSFLESGEGDRIDAVYAHNDDMALGAIQAIEEKGLKPNKDIILISIDGVRGAFEAMKAGKLAATVECNPLLGPMVFDTIEKVLKKEKVDKYIQVPTRLFEQKDAAKLLPTRKY